ncbi:unnamed protein product [Parnassius mnemosyne]|uniref:Reverse transcriptase domain-containing protein n=1 Tax=Parnassius mnemosyne TaxID=213953 RepID=A0AAV1KJ29_9NEOP
MKVEECGLRMGESTVKCLLYADDQVIFASSAAELQMMSEKWLTYENLKEEILEKIRKIEEERHTVDLWSCDAEWGRKRRRRQVAVSPPYVVYMLPDADIMEDWRLVRKLLERAD